MTADKSQLDSRTDSAFQERHIDYEKARRGTRLLLEAIGSEPDSGALPETWQRRVPETLATLTEGMCDSEKPDLRTFEAESEGLVVKTGIPLHSLCEHHMLPYHGVAHVGYRPDEDVVGLSKLSRYVRWQARQLTMQEELTYQIATGLRGEISAQGVIVEITATHLCEAMRGIETATETTTRATAGELTAEDKEQFNRRTQDND